VVRTNSDEKDRHAEKKRLMAAIARNEKTLTLQKEKLTRLTATAMTTTAEIEVVLVHSTYLL
jgi:hypothetical protein